MPLKKCHIGVDDMSWKLRWAGWNKGMKRYTKPDGSYGYYDPNRNGAGSLILGVILLIFGLFSPLNAIPRLILIIVGIGLIYREVNEFEQEEKSRKYEDQGEDTWDRWIREDKDKKKNSYKAPINKAEYLRRKKEKKEQEKKDIKDKIAKYKAESKKRLK